MSVSDQCARLERAVEDMTRCLQALAPERYLEKLNGWAPRDILAHLVGWNRATIKGSEELRRGEVPYYDLDPGEDYSEMNAAFVREHSSVDREALLAELEASAGELSGYLLGLGGEDWSREWGVRHGDELLTIQGSIDDLIDDYGHHRRQIETWLRS